MRAEYRVQRGTSYYYMEEERGNLWEHELKMLLYEEIEGLIPVSVGYEDAKIQLFYLVAGLVPLEDYFSARQIPAAELRRFFAALRQVEQELEDRLLSEEGIGILPGEIFLDARGSYRFIYNPFSKQRAAGREEEYLSLAMFFLEHVDFKDQEAVSLAYQFQNLCLTEQVTPGALLQMAAAASFSLEEDADSSLRLKEASAGWEESADSQRESWRGEDEPQSKKKEPKAGASGILKKLFFSG